MRALDLIRASPVPILFTVNLLGADVVMLLRFWSPFYSTRTSHQRKAEELTFLPMCGKAGINAAEHGNSAEDTYQHP